MTETTMHEIEVKTHKLNKEEPGFKSFLFWGIKYSQA